MPAYNEGACIFENISMTRKVLGEAGIEAEIVAVDDGSSDNTIDEIKRAVATYGNVVAASNPYNMGKGMALRSGFEHSKGDIIVFLDADLDLHPSQILNLIEVLNTTPCDIVVTSKHHPESKLDYPWSRKAASWMYYFFIKTLFNLPVRDTQTGLKVFRRKVLDDVLHRLLVKKFAYDVELLATAVRFGYSIVEVPVILEFKRDLKWGRIRFEDILNLFIDTLAVLYRLRIMRYYDKNRHPQIRIVKPVLVAVRGCPPPAEVMKRISLDTNTRIVCISDDDTLDDKHTNIQFFRNDESLVTWITDMADSPEIIGFLCHDCLPVGSWVKNAVRNFEDPEVCIVCGPVIPGDYSSRLEHIAGLVFSSIITRGKEAYLYGYRPVQDVVKGSLDSVFFRAELLREGSLKDYGFRQDERFIYSGALSRGKIRYDPDAAVMKKVPPLFLPYFRFIARESFSDGYDLIQSYGIRKNIWPIALTLVWLILITGWVVLPIGIYKTLWVIYLSVVLITSLSCLDPISVPLFFTGIICNHIVRAIAFPAGILSRLIGKMKRK